MICRLSLTYPEDTQVFANTKMNFHFLLEKQFRIVEMIWRNEKWMNFLEINYAKKIQSNNSNFLISKLNNNK